MNMKTCITCKNTLSLDNFVKNKSYTDGIHIQCKACTKNYYNKNKEKILEKARIRSLDRYYNKGGRLDLQQNPEKYKEQRLKYKFDISLKEYEELKHSQNNCCAICKNKETSIDSRTGSIRDLAVDHCHITNKIRGLLCGNCNKALGLFKDNIEYIKKAILYLEKTK